MKSSATPILISILLIFTTTVSIWNHLLLKSLDPIEISKELEVKENEKEIERDFDDLNNPLAIKDKNILYDFFNHLKAGHLNLTLLLQNHTKLYVLFQQLKIHC